MMFQKIKAAFRKIESYLQDLSKGMYMAIEWVDECPNQFGNPSWRETEKKDKEE